MQLPPPLKSASHPLARQARSLARGVRERREEGLFLIEGPRGIEEALAAKTRLVWVLVAASKTGRPPFDALLERCSRAGIPIQPVQDQLLERISPSEQGPGLVAACPLPPTRMIRTMCCNAAGWSWWCGKSSTREMWGRWSAAPPPLGPVA